MDYLTIKEIVKLGKALSIIVGERYWRYRTSCHLVEMDELAGEEDQYDWQYLCTNLDKMSREDNAFDNRNHVVEILRDHIKPEFLRKLEQGNYPSLKQVIVESQQQIAKITD